MGILAQRYGSRVVNIVDSKADALYDAIPKHFHLMIDQSQYVSIRGPSFIRSSDRLWRRWLSAFSVSANRASSSRFQTSPWHDPSWHRQWCVLLILWCMGEKGTIWRYWMHYRWQFKWLSICFIMSFWTKIFFISFENRYFSMLGLGSRIQWWGYWPHMCTTHESRFCSSGPMAGGI